jgi:formyl-CoA transferase
MPADPLDRSRDTPLGPLSGLRIIDCSTVLAGPYCTMLLGDLGADVVKVEPPDGDATRGWGPPWVGGSTGQRTAAYYLAVNRNKRSVRLDLKTEEGAEILARLLERGDVVVENFRVGGFARLGFGDERLRAINPSLVHLAISGFGPDGRAADLPGYDFVIQAVSGLMSITGAPDAEGGQPTGVGVAISDVVTGMLGAVSVLAALVGRERGVGRPPASGGQRIDISLLGATLASLVNQAQNAFVSGAPPRRLGNAHPNIVPYEAFETADDPIVVAIGSSVSGRGSAKPGLSELARDPRSASNGDRRIVPAAPDPGAAVCGVRRQGMAGRARRGLHPVWADQRHHRRLWIRGSGGPRDDRRAGASRLGRHSPGRHPIPARRYAGDHPDAPARAR